MEWEVNQYLSKNTKFFAALKQLHQDIEEVNCVQVYLSWLTQIVHLRFVYMFISPIKLRETDKYVCI